MLKKQKGFSLIELLSVLSFIGIFTAMVINFSLRNKDRWSLRDMTREITSTYYQAKQRASRENASVRLDVGAKGYTMYHSNGEILKSENYPEKITAISTANFLINSSGFIIDPGTLAIANSQTIKLTAPRGAYNDTMTITIYPYGGLRVEKDFK
jgi:prepilin-type N-terminal cleavage/methylation domain-containing protein